MMKKIIVIFFLLIFCGTTVRAQTTQKTFDQMSIDELLDLMSTPVKNEELFVQMLFSLPPEYHQYVMPMVGDLFGISEKVRMMPGIVEWRRKLPTRIAPRLEKFAKEHLRYLNPALYPYLMPEAWPDPNSEGHDHKSQFVPTVFRVDSAEEMERVFPSSIKENTIAAQILSGTWNPKERKSNQPALTEKDVDSVVTVMSKLKKLESGPEGGKRRDTLVVDYQDIKLLIEAHVNPCHSLISRLDKIEADKWFKEQVEAENMNVSEFIQKCDATVKAYRMSLAAPGVLIAISDLIRETNNLPNDAYQRQVNLALLRMFYTTKADMEAIKNKKPDLEKIFHEKLLFLGTPVLLDF